ncbi:MAG TPA: hypothetical protein VKR61_14340 [Bryobacteraceae bacterium]|nr:hypothetical protein [Bryobacteraceae bacterium]
MQSIETEEVTLETPAGIANLLMSWGSPVRRRTIEQAEAVARVSTGVGRVEAVKKPTYPRHATGVVAPAAVHGPGSRPRVCRCGICSRCVDNARWDRIFNEKFADPSYYGQITVRHNSSLASA